MELPYDRWPNFTRAELDCQETGQSNPNVVAFCLLMDRVQQLRTIIGIPFGVTSGYRSPQHSLEAAKAKPGYHTIAAVDFHVPTAYVHVVLKEALRLGFTGIGVNLKGARKNRFIHLDMRELYPVVWSY